MWCASAGEWGSEAMMSVTHKKKWLKGLAMGGMTFITLEGNFDCPYVVQRALFLGLETKETLF